MRLEGVKYQQDKLRELNKYQDTLDVFIHILMIRLPAAFTLVNMTLMIWLVQTIFSSLNADIIPRSLYFYAPLLTARPIIDISFSNGSCNSSYNQIILKTFPSLTAENIRHSNLTKWRQKKVLCIKTSQQQANFSKVCQKNQKFCSGLCVTQKSKCPITGVKKVNSIQTVLPSQQVFYNSNDKLYKYILSRQSKNTFIIGFSAQYQYQCANQFKYFQTFSDFGTYWSKVKECGKEGSLSSQTYHSFDSLPTLQFLMDNGLWSQTMNDTWASSSITTLGYINKIQYKIKQSMCTNAQVIAKKLSNKILQKPVQPLFSKSLLIISFVFFTICWAWLLAFYCCQAETVFKNTFVILLAIIQFITIAFIYQQNSDQFQLQNLIQLVSKCVDQNIPAFDNWSFGLSNRYPLISIMFACCSFVLLQATSYFMSCFFYEVYTFYRHQSLFGSKSYASVEDFN